MMSKLTYRERVALRDALEFWGGWGLFYTKTTEKLGERGFFELAKHHTLGMQWRLTESGRASLSVSDKTKE